MTAKPEGPPGSKEGSEDTLLATDPDPASDSGATVGATLDLPSHEPAHREAAPNVLRPRATGERYRLGIELGRGGMGRVVEAFDVQLGRTVALKEVLPQITGTPRRFAREVQITARLEHPAIVPLYDAGIGTDGRPFYVMRRVSGRPLDELLARAKRLDERLVLLPAVLAAIDAIAHAHKRGVIHRDLKPANILVGDLGETVVIDWGLAKVIGEEDVVEGAAQLSAGDSLQTQYGSVFGTPGFMSPEQARGEEQGTEGDVYALGACLYQLLAGKPPHAGKSATELLASTHQHKVLPLDEVAPNAPAELVAIVEKALRFDADQRYPNAEKLGEDVRRFSTGQLVKAHRYSRRERVARFARKHRGALGVAAVAMVTLAILAWIGVTRIVAERNAATDARDDARVLQAEAEAARDREADRAEAMIVARARALVETNPTEAIAVLKQIATSTKHADEIRAIAKSAAVRGIAFAFDGPAEMTISLEMSPDGTRLAQGTRAGSVYVWDLVRRKLVIAKTFPVNVHVRWVAHGQLLVTTPTQAPVLFDPANGQVTAFDGRPCGYVETSLAGDRAVGIDDQHHAVVYDIAARTATTLEPTHAVTDARMPPDGTWVALIDRREVRAVELATGKLLARFDQAPPTVVAVTSNRLAVSTGKDVWELTLGPQQAWAPVPIHQLIVSMVYVGTARQLVLLSPSAVSTWNGTRIAWSTETTDLQLALVTPAHG
ncbi:MAG: serine/threonine-protein kinase, partial [Proteobacteria bacterium]|nr:serine/threonine-protein kinase [Pseudomonadota bacterium]